MQPTKKGRLTPAEYLARCEASRVEPTLPTAEAAELLAVTPQTMRRWSCYGDGPIAPVRIGRTVRWKLKDIQALLSGAAA